MKINEISYHSNRRNKLSEGFGSSLLQSLTGIRAQFDPRVPSAEQNYIKDFVGDALNGLKNAIDSGIVDPNATKQNQQQVDPSTVQPAQGQPAQQAQQGQQQQAQQGKQASSKEQRQQSIQQLNNYIKKVSQSINAEPNVQEKMKRIKEVVNVMADRKGYPEWDNAKATVERIIKQSKVDGAFAGSALKRLETGKTMTESWRVYFINQLLEQTNVSWDDLNLVVLKESKNYFIANKNFYKLDTIFESLLNEQPNAETIQDWLEDWYKTRMKGIDYSKYQSNIQKTIDEVTWPEKEAKPALEKLAKLSWSIGVKVGAQKQNYEPTAQGGQQAQAGQGQQTQPAQGQAQGNQAQSAQAGQQSQGAQAQGQAQPAQAQAGQDQAQPAQAGQGQQAKPSVNVDELYQKIKDAMAALKQQDPASFQALVKELEK